MPDHEHFRTLSALAATGQLSSSEARELNQHLDECESCHEAHDDYSHLIQHQLPKADPIRWRLKRAVSRPAPDAELRDRFFARARAEGIHFSMDAECSEQLRHPPPSAWRIWLIAASAFALFTFILGGLWEAGRHLPITSRAASSEPVVQGGDISSLRADLDSLRNRIALQSEQLQKMRQERVLSQQSLKESRRQLLLAQDEVRKLSKVVEADDSNNRALLSADQQKENFISTLRNQNDELSRSKADNLGDMVLQQQRIRDLTESLERESTNLERERQLMAATNDVRQLMGARDLHILDVRDVNADSKSAKPFGRVFYAEGQSLIFYAFDLPSGSTPAKYSFQAWGEVNPDSPLPRNLGTFEVDDHQQRRWVLKVKNPDLLAGIHSVFVTSESLQDAKEPRGKKLLYAYIAGQPNHP